MLNWVIFVADLIADTHSLITDALFGLDLYPFPIGRMTPSKYSFDSLIAVIISVKESAPVANVVRDYSLSGFIFVFIASINNFVYDLELF